MPKDFYVDSSDWSHVLFCNLCNDSVGLYLSRREANTAWVTHKNNFHFTPCSAPGCIDRAESKGMCPMHYNKLKYRASANKKRAL